MLIQYSYSNTLQIQKNYEVISDNYYFDKNLQPNDNFINLLNSQSNKYVRAVLKSAFEFAAQSRKIGYGFGAEFEPLINGTKLIPKMNQNKQIINWTVDCSGLMSHIFKHANQFLEVNNIIKKNYEGNNENNEKNISLIVPQFNTETMVRSRDFSLKQIEKLKNENQKIIHDYYVYIPKLNGNGFNPQSGDLLAYYNFKEKRGHVVMVIDPYQCIAINSTTYNYNPGSSSKFRGVYFNKIESGDCDPISGTWKSWDNDFNIFRVQVRHKLIDKENKRIFERLSGLVQNMKISF